MISSACRSRLPSPSWASGIARTGGGVDSLVGDRTDEISTQRYYHSVAAVSAPRRARLWGKKARSLTPGRAGFRVYHRRDYSDARRSLFRRRLPVNHLVEHVAGAAGHRSRLPLAAVRLSALSRGAFGAYLDARPDDLSRFGAHGRHLQRRGRRHATHEP